MLACPNVPPRPSWRPAKRPATLTRLWPYWTPPWCAPTSTPPGREKKSGAAQPALGRSRGGLSTKIHLVAVDERTALAMSLSAGQANDAPPGEQLVAEVISPDAQIRAVCADRAYDTDALRAELATAPAPKEAVIPPRANRRVPFAYDRARYRQRNRVERLVGRLKQFRAVATRYDKLDGIFGGLVVLCLAGIALR